MIILFDARNDNQEETITGQSVLFKSKACIKILGWRGPGNWCEPTHHIKLEDDRSKGASTCCNPNGSVTSPLVWPCHAAVVFNTYRIVWSDHDKLIIWLIPLSFSPFKRLPFPICAWKLGFSEAQCFPTPCISGDRGWGFDNVILVVF